MNSPDLLNPMPPIPPFLIISPEEAQRRADHWEMFPPKAMGFDMDKMKREESPETKAFRAQMEAEALAKRARMFDKLKRKKEAQKIDRTGQRWDARKNKWVLDLQLVAAAEREKAEKMARAGLLPIPTKAAPTKTPKAPKTPKVPSDKPKVVRAAKGAPIVRPCAATVTALPEKGKRREVALACFGKKAKMADIAKQLDCSEGSVRSHLTDLHQKHGFGYTITDGVAELSAPKGWKP
jgi:hypothetical protein